MAYCDVCIKVIHYVSFKHVHYFLQYKIFPTPLPTPQISISDCLRNIPFYYFHVSFLRNVIQIGCTDKHGTVEQMVLC